MPIIFEEYGVVMRRRMTEEQARYWAERGLPVFIGMRLPPGWRVERGKLVKAIEAPVVTPTVAPPVAVPITPLPAGCPPCPCLRGLSGGTGIILRRLIK